MICDFTAVDFPVFVCVILILISGDEGKISGCRESRGTKRVVLLDSRRVMELAVTTAKSK